MLYSTPFCRYLQPALILDPPASRCVSISRELQAVTLPRRPHCRAVARKTTSISEDQTRSKTNFNQQVRLLSSNRRIWPYCPPAESSGGSSRSINIILWVSVVLHATFLLVHIALVTLLYRHPEHNLIVPLEQQGKAATLTTVVLQIIGLVRSFVPLYDWSLTTSPVAVLDNGDASHHTTTSRLS